MTEINLFPKFIDQAMSPIAVSVGNTLSSVWNIVFGGVDSYSEKLESKRIHNLKQFKQQLENEVSSIPEEQLVEPPLHIIGPTLEASRFYFENKELRTMFAKLIAASINRELYPTAHPAFVEIIKQLSPDEAKILVYLQKGNFGFIHINAVTTNSGKNTLLRNFSTIAYEAGCAYPENTTIYLENLSRLNLILLDNSRMIAKPPEYEKISNHEHAKRFIEQANEIGKAEILTCYAESTLFGIHFYNTCIK